MSQTRKGSLIEVLLNISSGMVVAMVVSKVVYPLYGYEVSNHDIMSLTMIFTAVSIIRSYVWRRVFVKFFRG